ncbi:MAG: hypothetical protein Q8O56_08230 [Solirubrobacteraceae bacterium]|nr:hypothetical protein [Solirubrobacteraceae bacterium]
MKPTKKLTLCALVASLLACLAIAQPASAATSAASPYCSDPKTITNDDNGTTVTLRQGQCATLRLDPDFVWDTPKASNRNVKVYDIPTLVPDQTWGLLALGSGFTTITSSGAPDCDPGEICPPFLRLFEVKIQVLPFIGPAGAD